MRSSRPSPSPRRISPRPPPPLAAPVRRRRPARDQASRRSSPIPRPEMDRGGGRHRFKRWRGTLGCLWMYDNETTQFQEVAGNFGPSRH